MENLEERLSGLENNNCEVFGFTLDNAEPSQQERFIALLSQATKLEVLGLTALKPLASIKDEWEQQQAKNVSHTIDMFSQHCLFPVHPDKENVLSADQVLQP